MESSSSSSPRGTGGPPVLQRWQRRTSEDDFLRQDRLLARAVEQQDERGSDVEDGSSAPRSTLLLGDLPRTSFRIRRQHEAVLEELLRKRALSELAERRETVQIRRSKMQFGTVLEELLLCSLEF